MTGSAYEKQSGGTKIEARKELEVERVDHCLPEL